MRNTPQILLWSLVLSCATLVGCEKSAPPNGIADRADGETSTGSESSRASVTLRVAVSEDAQLVEAIKRLRGEWAELSGGELMVETITAAELLGEVQVTDESTPSSDLVIFPSRWLGELCEQNRLRPIRAGTLKSETLDFTDIFPAIRQREIVYGNQVMALPIGCPTPLLKFLASEDVGRLPLSWEEVPGDLSVGSEPYSLAYQLLARAACYARHPAREAVLFDPKSMTPRLTAPPFVRAMRELRKDVDSKPEQIARFVFPRRPIVAPSQGDQDNGDQDKTVQIGPLPGAADVFSPISRSWEAVDGEPQRVTLLATSGRLVGVTSASTNATSAFRLAAWLAGSQNAGQLSKASPSVANVRLSRSRVGDDWSGGADRRIAQQCAQALSQSLQTTSSLTLPRLLKIDRYLDSLDRAAQAVVSGDKSPEDALEAAATEWDALTDEIGRQRQQTAYLRHLGAADYEPSVR